MTTMTKRKTCPICGQKITAIGTTTDGRTIGSCQDAFYTTKDTKGRTTWHARKPMGYKHPYLYALKVYQDMGGKGVWVLTRVFKTLQSAHNARKDTRLDIHRDYPLMDPKITHPRYWEVDAFVGLGNRIEN